MTPRGTFRARHSGLASRGSRVRWQSLDRFAWFRGQRRSGARCPPPTLLAAAMRRTCCRTVETRQHRNAFVLSFRQTLTHAFGESCASARDCQRERSGYYMPKNWHIGTSLLSLVLAVNAVSAQTVPEPRVASFKRARTVLEDAQRAMVGPGVLQAALEVIQEDT